MDIQVGIFCEKSIKEIEQQRIDVNKRKKKATMQEIYGELIGTKCKNCEHFLRVRYNKVYFKCSLWSTSSCSSSDINANDTGCNKFKQEKII